MAETRARRPATRSVAASLLLALSVACSGIPSDGKVTSVKTLDDPEVAGDDRQIDQPVRRIVDPKGPRVGAAPVDIVRGFFEAHAAPDRNVARLFLARNASWADRGALVYSGERAVGVPVISGVQARAEVRVQEQARVNPAGEYAASRPAPVKLEVTLVKEGAEWRLSRVPQGLVISELTFRSSFRRTVLYHPDPRRRHLVPDFVFLPESDASAGDVLDALLRGPSSWLRPAVRSVIPGGTRVLGTPRLVNGILEVDLSLEANRTPTDGRPVLAAQVVRTLTEAGLGVTGVRLSVEGRRFAIPGTGSREVMTRSTWAEFDPTLKPTDDRLYFVHDGDLKVLDSASQSVVSDVVTGDYLRVALSRRGGLIAGTERAPDGKQALVVGPITGSQRTTVLADSLSTPTWDRDSDLVWVVRRTGPSTDVVAVPAEVAPERRVRVDGAPGPVQEVRLSPDGNRAMLVIGVGTARRLYAARVETTPALALTGLRLIAPTLSDVYAVAWHSDRGVQVIATRGAGGPAPERSIFRLDVDGYDLTGDGSDIEGLPGAPVAVAAAPTRVTAVEVAGRIYKKVTASNALWTEVARGSAPAYAG